MTRATIERLSIDDEALWIEDGGRPRGYPIGSSAMRQWLDETRDRLNSIATIPDPTAFVAAAREARDVLAEIMDGALESTNAFEDLGEDCRTDLDHKVAAKAKAALRRLGEVMGK